MTDRHRPTLATVAARAAVAPSTASLAFSGSSRVAPATRERVLAAAAELGYAGPDPVARSLRSRRSGVVGAMIGERLAYAFTDPVAVQLLDGVTEVLSPLGVGLLLLPGDADRRGPTVGQLAHVPLDAAVYATCGLEDDPALAHLQRRGVPVVAVDGPRVDDVVFVGIPDRRGTADLARHLAGLGHRRVAVVAMPLRLDGTRGPVTADRRARAHYRDVRERLLGVEEVLGPVPAVEGASNSVEEGERAGRALLDVPAPDRPTAVVAQSDLMAAGVLRAAEGLGLRVPEDVSVAGFDGVELPWLAPVRLTTVVQPTTEKGRVVGRAVAELVEGRRPDDVVLDVHLSVGTTTGPAPG
ncbi:transcriptional regulator, LacI family [Geodermatophilus dictyosporus]|uniref:Transcriptional regulator, LacI family n=1 Tax=Geodermatophilus dictyosporus TaxID=1523247 RepID=A0A1I5UA33_9ACTN|nr:LacI family DNA-binding transcriptional regulator [Geodermatophilus dictyosporus]SFP91506.1 transcriptional regulator, LacI family [Geodermatophilus dictyosporus]